MLLGFVLILFQVLEWSKWGFYSSDIKVILFILFIFCGAGALLSYAGRYLRKSAKQKEQDEYDINVQKTQPTFSQLEYEKEKKREQEHKNEYIPINGLFIWKFRGRKSAGGRFFVETNMLLLGMVFLAVAFIVGMVIIAPSMEKYTGENLSGWLQCIVIFLLAMLLLYGASHIGRNGNSMQLSFAKNGEGKLYVFDYRSSAFQDLLKSKWINVAGVSIFSQLISIVLMLYNNLQISKQITRIDREQIIEQIMDSGRIMPYGRQVISVKNIEMRKSYCRVYCALRKADGTLQDSSIVITSNYDHFQELLAAFEAIQRNSAFDRKRSRSEYEKYKPVIRVLEVVMPVVCILLLAGCVITSRFNARETVSYKKVDVMVNEYQSETRLLKPAGPAEVTVLYDGEEYGLENVLTGTIFYKGQNIQTYLADGVMYANEEGIRSTSTTGKIYFVFLCTLFGAIFVWVVVYFTKRDIRLKSGWE